MKKYSVRTNTFAAIVLSICLSCFSGCIYLVVGGVGAVGGYIVSPDTFEGLVDDDELAVWDAAIEIISIMGTIEDQSEDGGLILAKVSGAKVTITIMPVNDTTVKLAVKARKAYLPKISLAQDVYVKILNQLSR